MNQRKAVAVLHYMKATLGDGQTLAEATRLLDREQTEEFNHLLALVKPIAAATPTAEAERLIRAIDEQLGG